MTTYTDAFGGANIYPSDISYSAVALTADTQFNWPEETSSSTNLVTRIMDVSASGAYAITMPDAQGASSGETVLFNGTGASAFVVKDNGGTQIVSVAPGEAWQIYLTSNTTAAGAWRAFQYGAGTSTADASSLAGNGLVASGSTLEQAVEVLQFNSDYTAGASDRSKVYLWTGAAGTLTLGAVTLENDWFMHLRNGGTGAIVVDPPGAATIDDLATLSFQPGESAIITTDGTNYYTIGFGQSATFAFDYTSIAVAGTGNYTLTGAELNRIVYKFTGLLTGDRTIIVPSTVQQYWINNATTGAFVFTVKTALGTGVTIDSGAKSIFYCDGTDVIDADSSTLSTPISVAQGGTGATTASAARINLGGTAVGSALFTAADTASAWSTLGPAPSGVVNGGTY